MFEAVQGQMVFCFTKGERTIEAMVERLEEDEGDFTTDWTPCLVCWRPIPAWTSQQLWL